MRKASAFLLLLVGCLPAGSDELLKKLEQNPTDADTAARLALKGQPMVNGLLKLMEKSPRLRQSGGAVLSVAGEVCAVPCVEYIDLGASDEVKMTLLRVMGMGRWRGAVRKLINRLDHSTMGPHIYQSLTQILWGRQFPADPWAVEGDERMRLFAEWNRWLGTNSQEFLLPSFAASQYREEQLPAVKQAVEKELGNAMWQ
jgi:hypothetical protein